MASPLNITIYLTAPHRRNVPTYALPWPQTQNRRTMTLVINHGPLDREKVMAIVVGQLQSKKNLTPPLEALVIRMYKPFWNQEVANFIQRATPDSVFCTDIRLVDESEEFREECHLFFRGASLSTVAAMVSLSISVNDLLGDDHAMDVHLLRFLQATINLRVIVLVLPRIKSPAFTYGPDYKRHLYADALITILRNLRGLNDVFLPDSVLLFPEEKEEIISMLTRNGTSARFYAVPTW